MSVPRLSSTYMGRPIAEMTREERAAIRDQLIKDRIAELEAWGREGSHYPPSNIFEALDCLANEPHVAGARGASPLKESFRVLAVAEAVGHYTNAMLTRLAEDRSR